MVKRAAATHLKDFAKKLSKDHVIKDAIPMFVALANDDHVRRRRPAQRGRARTHAASDAVLTRACAPTTDGRGAHCGRAGATQDSVRVLTVPVLVTLAGLLPPADARGLLLTYAKALIGDKSWRVRYMVAEQIGEVRTAHGG